MADIQYLPTCNNGSVPQPGIVWNCGNYVSSILYCGACNARAFYTVSAGGGGMTEAQLNSLLSKLDEVKSQVSTSSTAEVAAVDSAKTSMGDWGNVGVTGLAAVLFIVGFIVGYKAIQKAASL